MLKPAKKILVVDDDRMVVRLITTELEARDYEVLVAYDGKEGLESALREEPDLIILDIMTPVMNGLEMLELLRARSQTPVIVISAYGDAENVEKARALGIECFLNKPFQTEALVEMIDIVFDLGALSDLGL